MSPIRFGIFMYVDSIVSIGLFFWGEKALFLFKCINLDSTKIDRCKWIVAARTHQEIAW